MKLLIRSITICHVNNYEKCLEIAKTIYTIWDLSSDYSSTLAIAPLGIGSLAGGELLWLCPDRSLMSVVPVYDVLGLMDVFEMFINFLHQFAC